MAGAPVGGGGGAVGAGTAVHRELFHAFRHLVIPPREFSRNMTVLQLACLEKLYRVFERC